MVIERIRGRSGAKRANRADDELPDKIDTEMLQKYDIDPNELVEEFEGGASSVS